MKITKIDRMVGTSKEGTVSSLDISKVSKSYEHELSNIEGVVRVDLPNTYSSIIGSREPKYILLNHYEDEYRLSMLPLCDTFIKLPLYFFSKSKNPKYVDFDIDADSQFFITDQLPFSVDDKITFSMVEQTETTERYILMEKNDN